MQAGKLRHRVVLKTASETQNSFGELTRTYATLATVWAAVEPLSGREYLDARQIEAAVDTRIRIRYRSDVTSRTQVTWNSHTYDIQSVITDPTNARELQLMCREVV